jgi:hypothetical protein
MGDFNILLVEKDVVLVNDNKLTKVYLRNCRGNKKGCSKKFFTEQPNKKYCSAICRYDSILESNRRSRKKNKNRKKEALRKKGTLKHNIKSKIQLIGYISLESPHYLDAMFFYVHQSIQNMKNETFHTPIYKGNKQVHTDGPSLPYQYVTQDDLYDMSISYLKENSTKCPRCGCKENIVERGLLICAGPECGLVLKAPTIHPGFEVDDLTPTRNISPTVQDFPKTDFTKKKGKKRVKKSVEEIKQAHENAYQKYESETGRLLECDDNYYDENDPLNPAHWQCRKKAVY